MHLEPGTKLIVIQDGDNILLKPIKIRIVVDTNVIASAIFFGGNPRELLRKCFSDEIEIVCTEDIFNEYIATIEKGTASLMENKINENKIISKVSQINLWRNLSGEWEDTRTSEEIINDIYDSWTLGREFNL